MGKEIDEPKKKQDKLVIRAYSKKYARANTKVSREVKDTSYYKKRNESVKTKTLREIGDTSLQETEKYEAKETSRKLRDVVYKNYA